MCNFCQAEETNTRSNILLRKRNVKLVPDSADIKSMEIFYKAFCTDFLVEVSGKCRTEKTYFYRCPENSLLRVSLPGAGGEGKMAHFTRK